MWQSSYLVLASSSSKPGQVFAKELDRLSTDHGQMQMTKNPLAGVNIDIHHVSEFIKEKYDAKKTIIQSTKYKDQLWRKNEIIANIAQWSQKAFFFHQFIFTGHGYLDGTMCIQTKQYPNGQPFTIEEFVDIWLKNRGENKVLLIYLDCCYSGKMAIHLSSKVLPQDVRIQVYCSSGPNHPSLDVNYYGGLLICALWANQTNNKYLLQRQKAELKQKFQARIPLAIWFYNGKRTKLKQIKWEQVGLAYKIFTSYDLK